MELHKAGEVLRLGFVRLLPDGLKGTDGLVDIFVSCEGTQKPVDGGAIPGHVGTGAVRQHHALVQGARLADKEFLDHCEIFFLAYVGSEAAKVKTIKNRKRASALERRTGSHSCVSSRHVKSVDNLLSATRHCSLGAQVCGSNDSSSAGGNQRWRAEELLRSAFSHLSGGRIRRLGCRLPIRRHRTEEALESAFQQTAGPAEPRLRTLSALPTTSLELEMYLDARVPSCAS
eukprot:IDg683t1